VVNWHHGAPHNRGLLILAGLGLVVVGLIAWAGGLSWFGRLPGDIRIERDNFRVYVPFVSMIIVSIVLTAILWVIRRFF
jgi:hypothetical protein